MIAQKERESRPTGSAGARSQTMRELLHHLDDFRIAAILETGASLSEVEEALLWAEGASDELAKSGHPLTGGAARVYEILVAEEAYPEEP